MTWKKGKVHYRDCYGEWCEPEEGWIYGPFAVHQIHGFKPPHLTHIPTGLQVPRVLGNLRCRRFAERLLKIGGEKLWQFKGIRRCPKRCKEVWNQVAKEMGLTK